MAFVCHRIELLQETLLWQHFGTTSMTTLVYVCGSRSIVQRAMSQMLVSNPPRCSHIIIVPLKSIIPIPSMLIVDRGRHFKRTALGRMRLLNAKALLNGFMFKQRHFSSISSWSCYIVGAWDHVLHWIAFGLRRCQ